MNSQLQCLHRLSIRVNCKESFVWADAIYGLDAGLAWSGPEAHAQYFTRPAARILHCLDLLGRALKLTETYRTQVHQWTVGKASQVAIYQADVYCPALCPALPQAIKGWSRTDQGELPSQKSQKLNPRFSDAFV